MDTEIPGEIDPQQGIESVLNEENSKKQLLGKTARVLVFVLSFIIGLLYFFPKNIVVQYALKRLQSAGVPLSAGRADIGLTGGFEFERVKYQLRGAAPGTVKAAYISGDISPFSYLISDTVDLTFRLTGGEIPVGKGALTGGEWLFDGELAGVSSESVKWKGEVNLSGTKSHVTYSDIVVEIIDVLVHGKFGGGQFTLTMGQVETNLGKALATGSVQLGPGNMVDIRVQFLPNEKFQKDFSMEYGFLKNQQGVQNDGNIEIRVAGSLNSPNVQIIGSNGQPLSLPGGF